MYVHLLCTYVGRKKMVKNWEEDDFYSSDEDTFLDRTGISTYVHMYVFNVEYICTYICNVCTYVCMYVYIRIVYVHVCICMYLYMYVCMYVCMLYVHTYVRTYVRTYVCMYVCMYVCKYIRTYIRMYVRTYAIRLYNIIVRIYLCIKLSTYAVEKKRHGRMKKVGKAEDTVETHETLVSERDHLMTRVHHREYLSLYPIKNINFVLHVYVPT